VAAGYGTDSKFDAPYDLKNNTNLVVNNTDGSIVGYKYFNFDADHLESTIKDGNLKLVLGLTPEGIDGTIDIMQDRPWASQGGKKIGEVTLKADWEKKRMDIAVDIDKTNLAGKHAIFLVFHSDTKEKSLCTLEDLEFGIYSNNNKN
jgi:hypothetical protein